MYRGSTLLVVSYLSKYIFPFLFSLLFQQKLLIRHLHGHGYTAVLIPTKYTELTWVTCWQRDTASATANTVVEVPLVSTVLPPPKIVHFLYYLLANSEVCSKLGRTRGSNSSAVLFLNRLATLLPCLREEAVSWSRRRDSASSAASAICSVTDAATSSWDVKRSGMSQL